MNLGFEFILHIFGALMSFVVLQKLAKYIRWSENKVFCFIGKNSMSIYLFHQQIIYWLNGMINPHLHVVINFVTAIAISLLISMLMMKFKFTRALIGEK